MPNTPNLALPYPALGDAPQVPQHIQSLASALDALRVNAHVSLTSDYTFTSTGFVIMANLTSSFLNGGTALTSSYRLSVPKTGIYRVSAQARLTLAAPVNTGCNLALRSNSGDSSAGGATLAAAWSAGAADVTLTTDRLLPLNANDYLQMVITGINGQVLRSGSFGTFISLNLLNF